MSEDNIAPMDFVEDLDDLDLEDRLKDAEALSREIEQKIKMETPEMLNVETPSFQPPKSTQKKEKATKPAIIEKILRLQKELDVSEPRPESHFKRMTKAECEEYLAWLVNKGVNKVQGTEDKLKKQTKATEHEDEETEPEPKNLPKNGKYSKDWGAKGLFQFNLILCKVAELGSANFKEQIHTDLVGLCDDVIESKDELVEIMAEIYEEHGESIGEYLTPLNRYFLLMSTLGANRAIVNRERVEKEIEKKSKSF